MIDILKSYCTWDMRPLLEQIKRIYHYLYHRLQSSLTVLLILEFLVLVIYKILLYSAVAITSKGSWAG